MTHPSPPSPAVVRGAPSAGRLLSVSVQWLRSARVFGITAVIAPLLALCYGCFLWLTHNTDLAAAHAAAERRRGDLIARMGVDASLVDPDQFYTDPRYLLTDALPDDLTVATSVTACILFILGASLGGADWQSRSANVWILAEPRRHRLLVARVAVIALAGVLLSVVVLAIVGGAALVTAATRGTADGVTAAWLADILQAALRGTLVVAALGALGTSFGWAARSAVVPFATVFVYVLFAEAVVRNSLTALRPWTLTVLIPSATELKPPAPATCTADGLCEDASAVLAPWPAALAVTALAVVLLAVAWLLVRRREVR
ncbi:hypothetical protein ACFVVL_18600 [Kitasatospora sp. NPDC058115]|uniref:hypothetical protein n=1 Tax=Kitasatospora sp. NPDC058115 TaxID=3346347 RepID=UPI0036D823E3